MTTQRQTRRSKLTLSLASTKPRNPLAVVAKQRRAGSHTKSSKAQRAADRSALRKLSRDTDV